jgi:hypothetical protein
MREQKKTKQTNVFSLSFVSLSVLSSHRSPAQSTAPPPTHPRLRLMTDHEVDLVEDSFMEFNIKFHGPKDSTLCVCVCGAERQHTTTLRKMIPLPRTTDPTDRPTDPCVLSMIMAGFLLRC